MSGKGETSATGEDNRSLTKNDCQTDGTNDTEFDSNNIQFNKERVDAVIISLAQADGTFIAQ